MRKEVSLTVVLPGGCRDRCEVKGGRRVRLERMGISSGTHP